MAECLQHFLERAIVARAAVIEVAEPVPAGQHARLDPVSDFAYDQGLVPPLAASAAHLDVHDDRQCDAVSHRLEIVFAEREVDACVGDVALARGPEGRVLDLETAAARTRRLGVAGNRAKRHDSQGEPEALPNRAGPEVNASPARHRRTRPSRRRRAESDVRDRPGDPTRRRSAPGPNRRAPTGSFRRPIRSRRASRSR